ncbi:hypothetical protein BDF14DRAFT_1751390 [Spinellus fusiger]|nr:hypothetical protein BDF14DRAFT_1751390 [Spinellus fusiger]
MTGRTATGFTEEGASSSFNQYSKAPTTTATPHRCNEHLEDVLSGLSTLPMEVTKPFSVFFNCLRSKPGQEPTLYRTTKAQEQDQKKKEL